MRTRVTAPDARRRAFRDRDGNRRAVVTEQGATLFRAQWEGKELLDTIEEDGYASHGCYGQHLMPWPGRVPKVFTSTRVSATNYP